MGHRQQQTCGIEEQKNGGNPYLRASWRGVRPLPKQENKRYKNSENCGKYGGNPGETVKEPYLRASWRGVRPLPSVIATGTPSSMSIATITVGPYA
eukprot:865713-Rhodomonas_salina.1